MAGVSEPTESCASWNDADRPRSGEDSGSASGAVARISDAVSSPRLSQVGQKTGRALLELRRCARTEAETVRCAEHALQAKRTETPSSAMRLNRTGSSFTQDLRLRPLRRSPASVWALGQPGALAQGPNSQPKRDDGGRLARG